jgi:hypothetical protein
LTDWIITFVYFIQRKKKENKNVEQLLIFFLRFNASKKIEAVKVMLQRRREKK